VAKVEPRYRETAQAWLVPDTEAESAVAPYGGGDAEAVERRRQRAMSVSPSAQGGPFTERSK